MQPNLSFNLGSQFSNEDINSNSISAFFPQNPAISGEITGNEMFTQQGGYSNGGHGNNCTNTKSQWT